MLNSGSSAVNVSTKKLVHCVGPISLTCSGSVGSHRSAYGSYHPEQPVPDSPASFFDVSMKQSNTSGSIPRTLSDTVTRALRADWPLRYTLTYVVPNGSLDRIRVYLPFGTSDSWASQGSSGSPSRLHVRVSLGWTDRIPAKISTSAVLSDQ